MIITDKFIKNHPDIWEKILKLKKQGIINIVRAKAKKGWVIYKKGLSSLPDEKLEEIANNKLVPPSIRRRASKVLRYRRELNRIMNEIMANPNLPLKERRKLMKKAWEEYKKKYFIDGVDIDDLHDILSLSSEYEAIADKLPLAGRSETETQNRDEAFQKIRQLLQSLYL